MSSDNRAYRQHIFFITGILIIFKYHMYYVFLQEVIEDILDLHISVKETSDFLQFVSGEKVLHGSVPLAHRYGGHQVTNPRSSRGNYVVLLMWILP